jgi:hypothetical protein
VTCRVLGFSKQAFYKWRTKPVSDRDYDDAHLINAAVDVHHDDPEFGYRFVTDELAFQGWAAPRNRVNRLCTAQQLWSVHADSGPTASSWAAPDSPREAPVCVLAVRRGGAGSARCLVPGPSPVRPRPSDELDLLERAHPGHKRSLHRASCSNPCRPVWRPYASVYAYRG